MLLLSWPPPARGFSKLSKADLSSLLQQQHPGLVSLSAVPCECLPGRALRRFPSLEWVDLVLFNKNNSFLLGPAAGRGGGRLEAVQNLARQDPGTGLLQPGHLQEASGSSRPQPLTVGRGFSWNHTVVNAGRSLWRAPGAHLCPSRGPRPVPRWIFNICKDEEHTSSLSNLCQCSMGSKKVFF